MAGRYDGGVGKTEPVARRRDASGAILAEPKAAIIVLVWGLVVFDWQIVVCFKVD